MDSLLGCKRNWQRGVNGVEMRKQKARTGEVRTGKVSLP